MVKNRNEAIILISRLCLGLMLFLFGLNGFFQFIPVPEMSAPASKYIQALFSEPYMLASVKIVEVIVGLMLLSNMYIPLALILIAPIIVQIVLFHAVLDPAGLKTTIAIVVMYGMLIKNYWKFYKTLLIKRV